MSKQYRYRRIITVIFSLGLLSFAVLTNTPYQDASTEIVTTGSGEVLSSTDSRLAINGLSELEIKGRAPKTGYLRSEFGSGWATKDGCDTRNIILNRDLTDVVADDKCNVLSGKFIDPYTGTTMNFVRGTDTSSDIQIDHVVALGDAWQKGAQLLSKEKRVELANDPLELLAVNGESNMTKSDGDAATWLPPNKAFRCQYVARQIAVKQKYDLWVTQAEHDAISNILNTCSVQQLPSA